MSAAKQVGRPRDAQPLTFCTDAVVAIALRLLTLPLMDAVSEASAKHLARLSCSISTATRRRLLA